MAFTLNRARKLMAMSNEAYKNLPDVSGITLFGSTFVNSTRVLIRSAKHFTSDTQGFVASNNRGDIVVAFRGSDYPDTLGGIKDWVLSDSLAIKVLYPTDLALLTQDTLSSPAATMTALMSVALPISPKFVHAGFLIAYADVRRQVLTAVRSARRRHVRAGRTPRILVTGHSLGGAIAVHAGLDLARQFRNTPVHVYTFGAPRTGNNVFEFYAMSRIREFYHVINDRDPIPLVPPLGPKTTPRGIRYDRMAETWYINSRLILRPNMPYGTLGTKPGNHYPEVYLAALNSSRLVVNRHPRSTAMR